MRNRSISLRDRMLVASITLAAIVIGVFVALILALSSLHNANKQEARSKKVTASALALDRLVLGVETGLPPVVHLRGRRGIVVSRRLKSRRWSVGVERRRWEARLGFGRRLNSRRGGVLVERINRCG